MHREPRNIAGEFGVNTYSYTFDYSAWECLSHLAEMGHVTFELMVFPGHLWPSDLDETERRSLRNKIEEGGLRVLTLNQPNLDLNLAACDEEMRRYTRCALRSTIELAGDLQVPGVIIGPGKANPLFPAPRRSLMERFFEAMDELAPAALRAGTSIYVENMPFSFLPEASSLIESLDEYGDPSIGIVYDFANAVFVGEDATKGLKKVQERLRLVHLSDTTRQIYEHGPVGTGVVPFAEIMPVLKTIGYQQLPMLEIISREPDAAITESVLRLSEMELANETDRQMERSRIQ